MESNQLIDSTIEKFKSIFAEKQMSLLRDLDKLTKDTIGEMKNIALMYQKKFCTVNYGRLKDIELPQEIKNLHNPNEYVIAYCDVTINVCSAYGGCPPRNQGYRIIVSNYGSVLKINISCAGQLLEKGTLLLTDDYIEIIRQHHTLKNGLGSGTYGRVEGYTGVQIEPDYGLPLINLVKTINIVNRKKNIILEQPPEYN